MEHITHDWNWTGDDLDAPLSFQAPRTIRLEKDAATYSDAELDQRIAVAALTPQHTYQFWTEHPERLLEYLSQQTEWKGIKLPSHRSFLALVDLCEEIDRKNPINQITRSSNWQNGWPLPNLWLGVLIRNQAEADERISLLQETPAAHRMLIVKPGMDGISLWEPGELCRICGESGRHCDPCSWTGYEVDPEDLLEDIGWVTIEPDTDPYNVAVVRGLIKQCAEAQVPCCLRQLGTKCYGLGYGYTGKGIKASEWPADLQEARQFPWEESTS